MGLRRIPPMLDPIAAFFQRIFSAIGRGIGLAISRILSPFIWLANWYRARAWIIKRPICIGLLVLFGFYGYFIWQTQAWTNFNPDYVDRYNLTARKNDAGLLVKPAGTTTTATPEATATEAAPVDGAAA